MDFIGRTKIQLGLTLDVMRSCIFADHIGRLAPKRDAWPALHDTCYADAINTWNQLFGDSQQQSHWSHYQSEFIRPPGLSGVEPFSTRYICRFLDVERARWMAYAKAMEHARNKRIAHMDHRADVSFERLDWAFLSAIAYRDWLLTVIGKIAEEQRVELDVISSQRVVEMLMEHITAVIAPSTIECRQPLGPQTATPAAPSPDAAAPAAAQSSAPPDH